MKSPLVESLRLHREELTNVVIIQCLNDQLLHSELGQFEPLLMMTSLMQPSAECVHRLDVSVARHRLHPALPKRDDEMLKRGFVDEQSRTVSRALICLERCLIPFDSDRRDVL